VDTAYTGRHLRRLVLVVGKGEEEGECRFAAIFGVVQFALPVRCWCPLSWRSAAFSVSAALAAMLCITVVAPAWAVEDRLLLNRYITK
jgi:hypothetical protein